MEATRTFPAQPESVAAARRFVERVLDAQGLDGELREAAVLLASELVTNAVLHARSEMLVRVEVEHRLRVEVRDANPRVPQASEVPLEALSGRGLHLVEALADQWGIEPGPDGKVVWFELAG